MTTFPPYRYRSSLLLHRYLVRANNDEMKTLRGALGFSLIDAEIEKEEQNHWPKNVVMETVTAIERAGGNSIFNSIRGGGIAYLEMLSDIAGALRLPEALEYKDFIDLEVLRSLEIDDNKAHAIITRYT